MIGTEKTCRVDTEYEHIEFFSSFGERRENREEFLGLFRIRVYPRCCIYQFRLLLIAFHWIISQYEWVCVCLHKHFSLFVEICVIWGNYWKIGSPALSFIDHWHCVIIIIVTAIAIVRFFDFIFKQWAWRERVSTVFLLFFNLFFFRFSLFPVTRSVPFPSPFFLFPAAAAETLQLNVLWMSRIYSTLCVLYIHIEALNSD